VNVARISENAYRDYETIYVLKTEIEDAAAMAFIEKMKALVEREGGKHIQVTNWGRKKLAWERDRAQKGMFVHHRYLGKPGIVAEYERTLAIDENVILRQTVKKADGVDVESVVSGVDVIQPPINREPRREERYDMDDMDDMGDGGHRGRGRDRDDDRDDDNDCDRY